MKTLLLRSASAFALLLACAHCLHADILSPPFISPGSGNYIDSVDVAIFTEDPGAIIYYTTDGTEPTTDSDEFTFPFTLEETTTVKAMAVRADDTDSAVSTADFEISPAPESVTPTIAINGKKSLKTTKSKIRISGTSTGAIEVDYQAGEDGDFKVANGTAVWSFIAKLKPGKNVFFVYAIGEEEDSDPVTVKVTLKKKKK